MFDSSAAPPMSWVFIELGAAIAGLALLARFAKWAGFSAIPLYLLAGLAFGNGGILPLEFSEGFVKIGAEIGVLLLLFMLGLEYTAAELVTNLRSGLPAGVVDFALNFTPGVVAGLMLGWGPLAAVLLGGVTYISSSGIVSKVLADLGSMGRPETPLVLSILVLEDLAMAVFLPLVAVLLIGQSAGQAALSIGIVLGAVSLVLFLAARFGRSFSRLLAGESDEIILLSTFGIVLLVAGIALRFQISAAVGAFLVGIGLSGPVVERTQRLIAPLRDLFAAVFFLFFGLEIDPATLPPVLLPAIGLGLLTAATKLGTGWWAGRRAGIDRAGRLRAGGALVARGEFSIVIAGLGVQAGLEPRLGALSAAYVLLMAVLGPVLARLLTPRDATSSPAAGRSGP